MTTNYARGATFERRVKAHLERLGWTVARSAGSRGAWDLVAIRPGLVQYPRVVLLQCKKLGRVTSKDYAELIHAHGKSGATECYMVSAGKRKVLLNDCFGGDWKPLGEFL